MSDHDLYSDFALGLARGRLLAPSENSGLGTSLGRNINTCPVGKIHNERARSPPHPRLLHLRFLPVRNSSI